MLAKRIYQGCLMALYLTHCLDKYIYANFGKRVVSWMVVARKRAGCVGGDYENRRFIF